MDTLVKLVKEEVEPGMECLEFVFDYVTGLSFGRWRRRVAEGKGRWVYGVGFAKLDETDRFRLVDKHTSSVGWDWKYERIADEAREVGEKIARGRAATQIARRLVEFGYLGNGVWNKSVE